MGDLVVDESHRMSAHHFGSEVKRTKRYDMGKRVGNHARNLLLMTATPHNGKDEAFQLFMALLDEDRFAGVPRQPPWPATTHLESAAVPGDQPPGRSGHCRLGALPRLSALERG